MATLKKTPDKPGRGGVSKTLTTSQKSPHTANVAATKGTTPEKAPGKGKSPKSERRVANSQKVIGSMKPMKRNDLRRENTSLFGWHPEYHRLTNEIS
ncbi:MAG: hypothetical protein FWC50_14460, partial [Planctomycetaceae bacterium]|nr:hypothetical protein [Planctomycetaceae bacterium]